jgi:predicted DNA-binding transcriptional regulator YafY
MRREKAALRLGLARQLAPSAEGLTLDEMAEAAGVGRRTVERMGDAIWDFFPQMEELPDGGSKPSRIPVGLDRLYQAPTEEALPELSKARQRLRPASSVRPSAALSMTLRAFATGWTAWLAQSSVVPSARRDR